MANESYTDAKFCLTEDEDFLIIEGYTYETTCQKAEYSDLCGNTVGVVTYDVKATITIDGLKKKTGTIGKTVGTVLSNLQTVLEDVGASGGIIIIDSITISHQVKNFAKVSLKATMYPEVSAGA